MSFPPFFIPSFLHLPQCLYLFLPYSLSSKNYSHGIKEKTKVGVNNQVCFFRLLPSLLLPFTSPTLPFHLVFIILEKLNPYTFATHQISSPISYTSCSSFFPRVTCKAPSHNSHSYLIILVLYFPVKSDWSASVKWPVIDILPSTSLASTRLFFLLLLYRTSTRGQARQLSQSGKPAKCVKLSWFT